MADQNGSAVERSDSPRLSSLFHQTFLSGLKRNTDQTHDLSKWLARGRRGSDISWTNPLQSRSNPAIGDNCPTVTNKDPHVARSLSDSKDVLAKLLCSGSKAVHSSSSFTASDGIKRADDISLDNNSDPHNGDSAFDEDIDNSGDETEPVTFTLPDQFTNDSEKCVYEGTDASIADGQDDWSWNERDLNLNLGSCFENSVPLFVDAPAPPGFGSSESLAETGNEPESVDPVTLILLKLLQQLEQDKCEEKERRRKEKHEYHELRRSKRKLRRPRQRKMNQNSKNDEAETADDADLKLFEQMKLTMEQGKALGPAIKQDIAGCNGLSSMRERLQDITMADLVLPEYTGWLFDQSTLEKVWCVVADMLFCIFENRTLERPISVIILPGCSVRSMVFKTPTSNNSSSKTASGIDRYQIILKESGVNKQYSFSVETRGDLQKWMTHLKPASNLDDVEHEPVTEDTRRHSLSGPPPSPRAVEAQTVVTPRYIPSPRNTGRRLSTQDSSGENDSPNSEKKSLNATIQLDSVGEFRRKLRRESDCEVLKQQPVKAMHFQHSESVKKKQGTFKKIRSLGSLDSLFKRKSSKGSESPDTTSLAGSDDGSISPSAFSTTDFTSGLPSGAGDFGRPQNQRLSRSLDFGKSDKGLSKGLYRTASDLKERFTRRKSECQVKLLDLNDIRMSGYLQQKFILKWQKLWCVVSGGCLYGFKSQSPSETASVAVALTNSTITYVSDSDKRHKKHFVFKISQPNKKNLYLNACDNDDLSHWLQCLQMEASKVQVDGESKDSVETCDSAYSSSMSSQSRTSPSTPREGNSPRSRHDSDSTDTQFDIARRYSSPFYAERHNGVDGSDADFSSSTDDWCNATFPMSSRHSIGLPANDFPEHDEALKHVWEKDRNYLFNLVRAKLRSFRRRRETTDITNTDLPGPNNEGLLLVTDEKHANTKRHRNTGSRKVKRASSFNVRPSSLSSADVVTSPKVDADTAAPESTSKTKRRKPLVVKKLAARDVEDPALSGYLERKSFSEQWMRYWYVLQGSSLFCYLTPDDNVTVDILDLRGYVIETLIDKYRGKRFVLELAHPNIISTHLSVDSRDEMEEWHDCVEGATGQAPSRQATVDQGDTFQDETETYEDKCISVKKKLLQEMLRQKYELEKKQAARQRRSTGGSSNSQTGDLTSEEKLITYATNLRQRRLSTQIKMDTIQKQMQDPPPSNTKRFFNFGGKKKVQQKNNDHLQVQLRELNTKLQEINQDLTSHINQSNGDVFDMNQNRKTTIKKTYSEPNDLHSHEVPDMSNKTDNGDINRTNSLTLKSSVQKLATKAFSKSMKNKTPNGSSRKWDVSDNENGYSSDSQVLANPSQNGGISYGDEYDSEGSERLKSDSLTDLTSIRNRGGDHVFSMSGLSLNGGNSPTARHKGSNSSITSPRTVHPDTMAEIDAFEDFTKQVLSARMAPA